MRKDWNLTRLLLATVLLVGCVVKQGGAQVQTARVSTKDSVRITVVSTRKVDTLIRTVTKTVHDSLCYAGSPLARIACPGAPTPAPRLSLNPCRRRFPRWTPPRATRRATSPPA